MKSQIEKIAAINEAVDAIVGIKEDKEPNVHNLESALDHARHWLGDSEDGLSDASVKAFAHLFDAAEALAEGSFSEAARHAAEASKEINSARNGR